MSKIPNMPLGKLVPKNTKYLAQTDTDEDGMILTVKGFSTETIKGDKGEEEKVILHFREDVKPMVLNTTNAQRLAQATKAETTEEAIGKRICVYADPNVEFGGKLVGGLRIRKAGRVSEMDSFSSKEEKLIRESRAKNGEPMPDDDRFPPNDDVPFHHDFGG